MAAAYPHVGADSCADTVGPLLFIANATPYANLSCLLVWLRPIKITRRVDAVKPPQVSSAFGWLAVAFVFALLVRSALYFASPTPLPQEPVLFTAADRKQYEENGVAYWTAAADPVYFAIVQMQSMRATLSPLNERARLAHVLALLSLSRATIDRTAIPHGWEPIAGHLLNASDRLEEVVQNYPSVVKHCIVLKDRDVLQCDPGTDIHGIPLEMADDIYRRAVDELGVAFEDACAADPRIARSRIDSRHLGQGAATHWREADVILETGP